MYEPLHHKYRPQTFSQLVGQGAIATTLTHALEQNRIAPAYLFCGPRGTGKTSSARILSKSLNCLSVEAPTAQPCGECDVCTSVNKGSSLDIVEIDAASNTGVDNIRELIERSQFAPVQCRYKVYVIDECLTGDTQITTDAGTLRIDNPNIVGQNVLSYNESSNKWEFKPVVRRFEQGTRQTYTIATDRFKIKCTDNHLIRTDTGWVAAKNVKEGMRILSPTNADAGPLSSNTEQMDAFVDSFAGTSSKATSSERSRTALVPSSKLLNPIVHYAPADVENGSKFLLTCERKATALKASSLGGKGIHSSQSTVSGFSGQKTSLLTAATSLQRAWDSSMEPCWEMDLSLSPIHTVDSRGWPGHMGNSSRLGWNIKQVAYQNYGHQLESLLTRATGTSPSAVIPSVILSWFQSLTSSSQTLRKNVYQGLGWISSRLKVLLGGTWTMDRFSLQSVAAHPSKSIQKDSVWQAISSWLTGYPNWNTPQKSIPTNKPREIKGTPIFRLELHPLENSCPTSKSLASHQWNTNLETVRSIQIAEVEPVYDIEVADNHNFVANGLLVHNCHMLSTAAFNALLKTLEEPPDRVVFVLATTDPQRVLPTIISRCQRFDFRRIPLPSMVKHLQYIAAEEAIAIAPSATQLVAQISQGGLRDAESLLDQLSLQPNEITVEAVWELVGAVPERDLLNLVRAIAADDGPALIDRVRQLMDKGREPLIVLQSLVGFYRDLLIAQRAPSREDLVAITPPTWIEMTDFVQQLSAAQLLASQQKLQSAEVQVKNTTQPRLWLEVTLTGLLPSALSALADLTHDSPSKSAPYRPAATAATKPPVILPSAPPSISVPPSTSASSAPASSTPIKSPIEAAPPSSVSPAVAFPVVPPAASKGPADVSRETPAEAPAEVSTEASIETPIETSLETTPVEVPFSNLADLWNKLLAVMVPRGTQMLMAQQGVLLSFDGVGAKVGFRSASLQKLAQSRVPNIEAAFENLFQRKIKVVLEVITAESSPAEEIIEPPPAPPTRRDSFRQASEPSRPSDVQSSSQTPQSSAPSFPQASLQANESAKTAKKKEPPSANGRDRNATATGTNGGGTNSPHPRSTNSRLDAPSADMGFDQDQEKIKRFANFFNGQIVSLSDDAEEGTDAQLRPHSSRTKSSDPGPDVPF